MPKPKILASGEWNPKTGKVKFDKSKTKHEEWQGFVAGEDISCGDMICQEGNRFWRCRGDKVISKPSQIEEWQKRFKQEFAIHFSESELQFVLEFICEEIQTARKEATDKERERMIAGTKYNLPNAVHEKIRKEAIHSILTSVMEEMEKRERDYGNGVKWSQAEVDGFNDAKAEDRAIIEKYLNQ